MPPALMPVPPDTLKAILEEDEWRVVSQDEYQWMLDHPNFDQPCFVPKDTGLVALELMMSLLYRGAFSLNTYFVLADGEGLPTKPALN